MSLLKYLSRVDPRYHDSQLPDPNGPLARAVPSSAISVANESVNVSLESNKKAAKRGVYQQPYSLHFVSGCSHRHHLASDFDSHE